MEEQAIFQVEDVLTLEGVGLALLGKCLSGTISLNMKAVASSGKPLEVVGIEIQQEQRAIIQTGETGGVFVKGVAKDDIVVGATITFST